MILQCYFYLFKELPKKVILTAKSVPILYTTYKAVNDKKTVLEIMERIKKKMLPQCNMLRWHLWVSNFYLHSNVEWIFL